MKAEKAEVSLFRRGDRRPLYTSPPRGDCSPPDEADTSAAAASATSTETSGREGEHGSSPVAAAAGAAPVSAAARAGPPLPSAGLAAFVGVLRSASARLFVGVLCVLPPCTCHQIFTWRAKFAPRNKHIRSSRSAPLPHGRREDTFREV